MSEIVGPMSLSDAGPVFLGEDMMQSKSHSPDTARLVDEEVRQKLIQAEDRCRELLIEYRNGLDLIARALLEHETISGDEVYRLITLSGGKVAAVKDTSFTSADVTAAGEIADAVVESPAEADEPANSTAD